MSKIKIEIKSWATGAVLFEYESENATVKKALESAIDGGANLSDADLSDADLSGADLRDATIYYSDNNIDAEYRKDRFMWNTQIESVETEMKHDAKSCRRWSLTWKNVLKIKSWKLKEAVASGAKPQSSNDSCAQSEKPNIAIGDTVAFKHGEAPHAVRGEVLAIKGDEVVVGRSMLIGRETYILPASDIYWIGRDEETDESEGDESDAEV